MRASQPGRSAPRHRCLGSTFLTGHMWMEIGGGGQAGGLEFLGPYLPPPAKL